MVTPRERRDQALALMQASLEQAHALVRAHERLVLVLPGPELAAAVEQLRTVSRSSARALRDAQEAADLLVDTLGQEDGVNRHGPRPMVR